MKIKDKISVWWMIRRADKLLQRRRLERGDPAEMYRETVRRENRKMLVLAIVFVFALIILHRYDEPNQPSQTTHDGEKKTMRQKAGTVTLTLTEYSIGQKGL
jgi:hypothetical protein